MTVVQNQRGVTYGFHVDLVVETCCSCAMPFAMPSDFQARLLEKRGQEFYCPAGHKQWYTGKTEAQKERERADQMERQARLARQSEEFYRNQAVAARRSAAAHRGQVTRIRNLVAKGICPVAGCRRNFHALGDHIQGQHPEWVESHPEVVLP